ncbi:zinc finger protein on ecdysone puffs isoform X1 [Danaus plexippus]|nr:zinc finger protein on ecdysone puffs isoform X1 [Danaus plexippus]
MANRRPQGSGRRMDFGRNDRGKNFRGGVSPWQGGGPGGDLPNLLPLGGGPTEATLALASNLINLLQPRQNPVPSLLDMPIRRDFGPSMNRYDRGYGPNRMGNQGNFRRSGNYNRAGERVHNNRKPFRPNDGIRQQNKSSPKKDADSKAKPVKESEEKDQEGSERPEKNEEDKKDVPKTRYDDINPQLLKCHICNKSMWDGRSFENHLSGRAHAIMMQKTAESYALTADTMRQEFKIREMKRTRKTGQQPPREFYCAMCDIYAGDGAIHRTTVGHRKLKKYLHPTCTSCHKEMPTRIELDEHRLTAEHLKNMQEKQETISKPKPEVMVISTLSMEQTYLRDDRQRWRREKHDRKDEKQDDADKEVKKEQEGETEGEVKAEDKKELSIDNENTVLDYKEGVEITNVTPDMLPAYSTDRGVGASFLSEFRCVQCTLCHKLLDGEETAQVHLRTWRHHQLFVRLINEKAGNIQPQSEAVKRSINDDSGTWKRRKTSRDEENGHEIVKDDHNEGTEQNQENPENMNELAADELEDWEQSVDDILNDESEMIEKELDTETQEETQTEVEEEKKSPQETLTSTREEKNGNELEEKPAEPKKTPQKTTRGRGRRRF